jgi:hypothetical protein
MASVPEPPPKHGGIEVTPMLLKWLEEIGADPTVAQLVKSRHILGLQKYGQGLMSDDGRDTYEDARQEAGDLLQYLYKALIQKKSLGIDADIPNHLVTTQIKEVLWLSLRILYILEQ